MRAKFYVTKISKYGNFIQTEVGTKEEISQETLTMSPVCPSKFGPNGEHEDNDFHRWSPSGSFELTITNPALFGKFAIGDKYYLDFTKSEK